MDAVGFVGCVDVVPCVFPEHQQLVEVFVRRLGTDFGGFSGDFHR